MRLHYLVVFLVTCAPSAILRAADLADTQLAQKSAQPSQADKLREYAMSRYDELSEQCCPVKDNRIARALAMPFEMVGRKYTETYPAESLLWMDVFADDHKHRVLFPEHEAYERDGERSGSTTVVVEVSEEYSGATDRSIPAARSLEILPVGMTDEVVWIRVVHQGNSVTRATVAVRRPVKEHASGQAGTVVLARTFLLERSTKPGVFHWSSKANTAKFVGKYGERVIDEGGGAFGKDKGASQREGGTGRQD